MNVSPRTALAAAVMSLLGIGGVLTAATAAPKSSPAAVVTLTPASLVAGSSNALVFRVQAKKSFSGGTLTVTLPTAGTWATPGDTTVTVDRGTCRAISPLASFSATYFQATSAACSNNRYFTVTFHTNAPTAVGNYTFPFTFYSSASPGVQTGSLSDTVTPAVDDHLAWAGSVVGSAVAGATLTENPSGALRVRVEDAYCNLTSSQAQVTVAISNNPSSGTLAGTPNPTAASSGVASFANLSIDKAGTGYTLVATATDLTGAPTCATGATSSAFNVVAGAATQLVFVDPAIDDVGAGGPLTATSDDIEVGFADAYGNPVVVIDPVTLALDQAGDPGPSLDGTTTQAPVAGVATFDDLSIVQPGTAYTLTASSGTLTTDTSDTFDITPAIVDSVTLDLTAETVCDAAGTDELCANSADTYGAVITLLDAYDNLVTGVDADYVSLTTDGYAGISAVTSNGDGTYSATITAGAKPGLETFTATYGDFTDAKSLTAIATPLTPVQAPQGAWNGAYGANGYALFGTTYSDQWNLPDGVGYSAEALYEWGWGDAPRSLYRSNVTRSGADLEVLAFPGDNTYGNEAVAYSATSLRVTVTFTNAYSGSLSLYFLDREHVGRTQDITVNDGNGPQVASLSSFGDGLWVTAPVSVPEGGSVTVMLTNTNPYNAVVSGLFLD